MSGNIAKNCTCGAVMVFAIQNMLLKAHGTGLGSLWIAIP
jgi:nitroreductase